MDEKQALQRLKGNLHQAAEACRTLAWHPRRGLVYDGMRKMLKAVEMDCTVMAYCRDGDTRWLNIAWMMGEAHDRSRRWVSECRTDAARADRHPLFQKLADNLDMLRRQAIDLETKATGRTGAILPRGATSTRKANSAPRSPSGLYLPPGYTSIAGAT